MVPKRAPWSHTASAIGPTTALASSGVASVVKSRSGRSRDRSSQQVADDPADEVEAVAGGREALGQRPALLEDRADPVGDHGSAMLPVAPETPEGDPPGPSVPSLPWKTWPDIRDAMPSPTPRPRRRARGVVAGSATAACSPTSTSTASTPPTASTSWRDWIGQERARGCILLAQQDGEVIGFGSFIAHPTLDETWALLPTLYLAPRRDRPGPRPGADGCRPRPPGRRRLPARRAVGAPGQRTGPAGSTTRDGWVSDGTTQVEEVWGVELARAADDHGPARRPSVTRRSVQAVALAQADGQADVAAGAAAGGSLGVGQVASAPARAATHAAVEDARASRS